MLVWWGDTPSTTRIAFKNNFSHQISYVQWCQKQCGTGTIVTSNIDVLTWFFALLLAQHRYIHTLGIITDTHICKHIRIYVCTAQRDYVCMNISLFYPVLQSEGFTYVYTQNSICSII